MSNNLRYKCLFLDHDDTSVNSTPHIHHKAYLEMMETLRPHLKPLTLEEWLKYNFDPGIMHYFRNTLELTDNEIKLEYEIWRKYTTSMVPDFFPGLLEILLDYKKAGGKIVVVSHSEEDLIKRDYSLKAKINGTQFFPDMIFGWTYDDEKRKPSPWPVFTALEKLEIDPKDSVILDDLKPGVLMGRNTNVDVIAAGWSYNVPEIRSYMEKNCVSYCETVSSLRHLLLGE